MSFLKDNNIYLGNTPDLMLEIEPESVALSVWSPPYFVGKEYEKYLTFQSWKELLENTIKGHFDALKPGGFMAINIDDILAFADESMPRIQAPNKSKLRCKITKEDILKAKEKNPSFSRHQLASLLGCSEQTIDRRLNGNNIRGGKYSPQTRVHLVGHLLEKYSYESGLYLYDRRIWVKDPSWQNSQWHSNSYRAVSEFEYIYIFWKPGETVIDRSRLLSEEWSKWGSRGVWHFRSVRNNRDHEAKFPLELPHRLIRLLTDEGDLVLDPFMGSGTTAVASIQNNRRYLGFDNQEKYVDLAKSNIQNEKMKPKALL
ncbi:DNA-methyltransferase [Morganella morganii]|uniref:DNA-methyltransferase n=1 Tax=Morganella morganii TaxID=582 RepID=UPI000F4997BE|nr:site-specific DNA-methyltransferase [Morganella morganii]ROJ30774.1 modification methylase [Morganella morganii]